MEHVEEKKVSCGNAEGGQPCERNMPRMIPVLIDWLPRKSGVSWTSIKALGDALSGMHSLQHCFYQEERRKGGLGTPAPEQRQRWSKGWRRRQQVAPTPKNLLSNMSNLPGFMVVWSLCTRAQICIPYITSGAHLREILYALFPLDLLEDPPQSYESYWKNKLPTQ